jgi:type III secretory pathway component EscS
MNASQGCLAALTQNAASIQQQSLAHLVSANQKAVEVMASTFANALASGFKPAL